MDAAQLRATQAPIKERYKSDPKAAMITLTAKGSIESEGIACKVETGRALAVAGLHPASGGARLGIFLGGMLLGAPAPPARGAVKKVGTPLEGPPRSAQEIAEGGLAFFGTPRA